MSHLPDQTPRLPKLPFLIGDAVLLIVAYFIATESASPFASPAIVWIVVCVVLATVLGAIPFLADYARKQDEALDERQRALEALTRTLTAAAEQISIATQGLHTTADLIQKNLKQAEQLPHRFQEKINELKLQLDEAVIAENETLQQEVNALRASEAEKLETVTDNIHRSVAEFTKLETASARQLALTSETLAKIPEALATAQNDALTALQIASVSLTVALSKAAGEAIKKIEATQASLPAPISTPAVDSTPAPASEPALVEAKPTKTRKSRPEPRPESVIEAETPPIESISEPVSVPVMSEPEVIVPEETKTEAELESEAEIETIDDTDLENETATDDEAAEELERLEPAAEAFAQSEPVAESAETVDPEAEEEAAAPESESVIEDNAPPASEPEPAPEPESAPVEVTPAKSKKTRPVPVEEPSLGLEIEPSKPSDQIYSTPSEDGHTRLLITAYIGIGNRLFIRGTGPGLSPEKGTPLQFVSIGKWRWESSEATAPVTFKIFKNDTVECQALGEQTVTAGQQHEATATF